MNESEIFKAAISLPKNQRTEFLDHACGADDDLRDQIQSLLQADEEAIGFLDQPAPRFAASQPPTEPAPADEIGTTIGPYRLREKLGVGGMGVVWAAEQKQPLRRLVAIKVIKPGMDSTQIVARFEAEREALSLMNHPNIARVLDAGTTDAGRPYFVMELISGIPSTDYCDQHGLSIRERLELFIDVCKAVQHAHQKGIIHRDIKPSNVLVTEQDGKPVAKVIDFGVAKALHQPLTERSIYTGVFQAIGTLAYMSPEQASLSSNDVDTRADVYGLGGLLYELLIGTPPFDREELENQALDQALRTIREQDAPKPSTRLSTLRENLTAVSKVRGTDPSSLGKSLRGDLDWIVMTALEKDRKRRYSSAAEFAGDLERFMADRPIVARPPSNAYRARKYVSRHKTGVLASVLVASALLAAGGMAFYSVLQSASSARKVIDSHLRETLLAAMTGDERRVDEGIALGDFYPADEALIRAFVRLNQGDFPSAAEFAEQSRHGTSRLQGPEHVGARAIGITSELWSLRIDKWDSEARDLLRIEPANEIESLLKAYALTLSNPDTALKILNEHPDVESTVVGLFIRAQCGLTKAMNAYSLSDVREAVLDLEAAHRTMKDSLAAKRWLTLAYGVTTEMLLLEGRIQESEFYADRATELATELSQDRDAQWINWYVYRVLERPALRNACAMLARNDAQCQFVAVDCLLEDDDLAALARFDTWRNGTNNKYTQIARAHLLGEEPGRREKITATMTPLLEDKSPIIRRHALSALCLVCTSSEIRDHGEKALDVRQPKMGSEDPWQGEKCIEYFAGHFNEQKLLEYAGEHRFTLGNFHFTIAMRKLAERDRAGALKHFRLCAETVSTSIDLEMGRMYYLKMKDNPNWPVWLAENTD